MKIDMHVHTNRSDGLYSPEIAIKVAIHKGLNGIAITDHDVPPPDIKSDKILVIPGVEVSTDKGHILLIGAKKAPKKGISIPELIDLARENDWLVIPAHPFDRRRKGIGEEIFKYKFDAIEAINCSTLSMKLNNKAREAAKILRLPEIAGSDAHCIEIIGSCYTIFEDNVESVDDVIESIRKGKTIPFGCSPIIRVLKCLSKLLTIKFKGYIWSRVTGRGYSFYHISFK